MFIFSVDQNINKGWDPFNQILPQVRIFSLKISLQIGIISFNFYAELYSLDIYVQFISVIFY